MATMPRTSFFRLWESPGRPLSLIFQHSCFLSACRHQHAETEEKRRLGENTCGMVGRNEGEQHRCGTTQRLNRRDHHHQERSRGAWLDLVFPQMAFGSPLGLPNVIRYFRAAHARPPCGLGIGAPLSLASELVLIKIYPHCASSSHFRAVNTVRWSSRGDSGCSRLFRNNNRIQLSGSAAIRVACGVPKRGDIPQRWGRGRGVSEERGKGRSTTFDGRYQKSKY